MSYNNTVVLIGNTASSPELKTSKDGKQYAVLSLYTAERYKDDNDNWQSAPSVRHKVLAYDPQVIANLQAFISGARLEIRGPLTYMEHEVTFSDGEVGKVRSAGIVAKQVKSASLPRIHKTDDAYANTVEAEHAQTDKQAIA